MYLFASTLTHTGKMKKKLIKLLTLRRGRVKKKNRTGVQLFILHIHIVLAPKLCKHGIYLKIYLT